MLAVICHVSVVLFKYFVDCNAVQDLMTHVIRSPGHVTAISRVTPIYSLRPNRYINYEIENDIINMNQIEQYESV